MNAESQVVAQIDALEQDEIDQAVDWQMGRPIVDDYSVNRYDKCQNCGHDWHGLPAYGCPGSMEKAERVPTGTITRDGLLIRRWDADMNYLDTWDPHIRDWRVGVGQPEQMTALQRTIQGIWEAFAGLMNLPEPVFDASAWFDAEMLAEIHQRVQNGEIQEMARETAMPRQIMPGRVMETTNAYDFNEAAAELRITAMPYAPIAEHLEDAGWHHLGFMDEDGIQHRHE